MARPIWSGSISFGLVQIPVGIHSTKERSEAIHLTLLDQRDHSPVGYRHVNKTTGEDVPRELRVKGYEVARGEYVILTDDDFKRANMKATETIDIHSFADAAEIPILRFEKPYYLAPAKRGIRPYYLLLEALHRTKKVGIATVVMRQRQHLCAVMPQEHVLVLEMLRYDDEVAEPKGLGLPEDPREVELKPAEVEMAERLITGMAAPFSTQQFRDSYRDDVMALIEERRAHPDHIPTPLPRERRRGGQVTDIMALLKQSIEERSSHAGAAPSLPEEAAPKKTRGVGADARQGTAHGAAQPQARHRASARKASTGVAATRGAATRAAATRAAATRAAATRRTAARTPTSVGARASRPGSERGQSRRARP